MPVLNIAGRKVTVDESFLKLSPEEQNETVDEIAGSLGINGDAEEPKTADAEPATFREAQRQVVESDPGALGASVVAGMQGRTWGASDEIMAGAFTPLEMAIGAITGEDADKGLLERARDAYNRGLDLQRAQIETARETNPIASTTGEIAGGLASAGKGMGVAQSTLGRAGVAALEGVAAGGVTGFMSGEGMEDRLEKAETGAKVGAVVGGTLAPVMDAAGAVYRGGKRLLEPFTEGGREQIAARRLTEGATDPDAVRRVLDEGTEELIPGSAPTTGQATGDMGILGMEDQAQTRNAIPFNQRRADQNAARVGALETIAPDGDPQAVASALRQWQQAIDDESQAAVDAARGAGDEMRRSVDADTLASVDAARTQAETLRRGVDTDSQAAVDAARGSADALRRGVDEETGATLAGATRSAQDEAGALGQGATPDVAGDRARGALETARKRAKDNERALWNAVDPDGTLTAPTSGVRDATGRIAAEMPATAEPFAAKESALYDTINGLGDTVSFRDMQGLRTRVNDAIKAERREFGETAALRRMTILRGALEDDLSGAIVRKVEADQAAVASGQLDVNETMMARFAAKRDGWFAEREAVARGADGGGGSGGYSTAGSTSIPGVSGAGGQARGRPGGVAGDPRLAGAADDPAPTFDDAARERLKAATDATRERAQTFDNDLLGPMRRRPSTTAPYDMTSSTVPSKVFFGGARSFDAIGTYRRAVGDDAEAMGAIRDYAVDRFQKAAGRPDGTIDPAKARTWRNVHKDALRAFPELDAQIMRAADASGAAADAGRMRIDALRDADRQGAATLREAERARVGALRDADRQGAGIMREADQARAAAMKEAGRPTEAETLAGQSRDTAIRESKAGALGKIAGSDDPQEIARFVGGIMSAKDFAQQMTKLRNGIGKDEAGREGLKRAVVDHMTGRTVGNTEAATSGIGTMKSDTFQSFVRQNKSGLRLAGFSDEEMDLMERLAADLQRSGRSLTAIPVPGRSVTAQSEYGIKEGDKGLTQFGKILAHMGAQKGSAALGLGGVGAGAGVIGSGGGLLAGGALAGAGVAAGAVAAMRKLGLEKAEDIVADALLHPERARLLLSKATGKGERDTMARLAKIYGNASAVTGTLEATAGEPNKPAAAPPESADRERPDSPRLTPDDRASPIPSDLIDDGKAVLEGEPAGAPIPMPSPRSESAEKGERVGSAETTEKWSRFAARSGTMNVPRSEMPQVKAEHRGALVNFATARGISHTEETVPAESLKATQAEFSPDRVEKAKGRTAGDRAILVSSDWQVVDGHHQWLAAREEGKDIRVIRFDAPIGEVLDVVREFPSSKTETAAEKPRSKMAELEERAKARRAA